ncbi:MAG TPA: CaiB/BaiF CoA-transferase family protein [Polyangiales bacterium]|nr:CaiB/BaiF CoA-transferase family protein [Polyangiales bacterium]
MTEAPPTNNLGALSHVRVLDMSRVVAGPWAGQILADLGAEVIKVERPGGGDDTRSWGPPFLPAADGGAPGDSAYYLSANRGKKSLVVDIAKPAGQELIRRLSRRCDVLIENYKAGDLDRYGLSYRALSPEHPGLIYCSITGFGQTGPMSSVAGYDFVIQAMGGLMSLTGERDDLPGGGPQKVGVPVADLATGLYATISILAALAHRTQSGQGQHIDMALLDAQVAMVAAMSMNYFVSGRAPGRYGNAAANIVPYQTFRAADGELVVAIGNDLQFGKFCDAVGASFARDPRFARNADRVRNRAILVPLLAAEFERRSVRAWVELLQPLGVPIGPINDLAQVWDDPQVAARGMKVHVSHPLYDRLPLVASPIKLSLTPPVAPIAPPTLGQHTDQVLREHLGMSDAELAELRSATVIG